MERQWVQSQGGPLGWRLVSIVFPPPPPRERTLSELPRSEPRCLPYALDSSRTLQSLLVALLDQETAPGDGVLVESPECPDPTGMWPAQLGGAAGLSC